MWRWGCRVRVVGWCLAYGALEAYISVFENRPHLLLKEGLVRDDQCRRHGHVVPAPDRVHETIALSEGRCLRFELRAANFLQGTARGDLQRFCQGED